MLKILCMVLTLGLVNVAQAQTPSTQVPNGTPTGSSATLTDAEIAKILVTINKGELEAAKMAKHKAKNGEVKSFAKMMIKEHTQNEAATKTLAKRSKMDLLESNMSKSLKMDAEASNKELKSAANFDKAYIDQQVAMHEKALATLNNTLIPQAKDAELKKHLEATQAAVTTHLDHAKKLQTSI